jgi:dGTPase
MSHTVDVLDFAQRIVIELDTRVLVGLDQGLPADGRPIEGPGCLVTGRDRSDRLRRAELSLAAAIALGHDLGHTPFGHAGEQALQSVVRSRNLPEFNHNWQSLRVVERVEDGSCDYRVLLERRGLGLSAEVLDGILNHTRRPDLRRRVRVEDFHLRDADPPLLESNGVPATAAGLIVALADEVAQRVSDVNDGLRQGAFRPEDIRDKLPRRASRVVGDYLRLRARGSPAERRHRDSAFRVALQEALTDAYAKALLAKWQPRTVGALVDIALTARGDGRTKREHRSAMRRLLGDMGAHDKDLQEIIGQRLHEHHDVVEANLIGKKVMGDLAEACLQLPRLALDWYYERYERDAEQGRKEAWLHLIDYLAAMTDDQALEEHRRWFGSAYS